MATSLSRRKFLQLGNDQGDQPIDILQEKYRRKQSGRNFSAGTVAFKDGEPEQTALRVGIITSGLAPYTGQWTENEALHLLSRTNFGTKKAFVDTLVSAGMSGAVDMVLTPTAAPAPPVNNYQNQQADEALVPYGADWTNSFFTSGIGTNTDSQRQRSLSAWAFGNMINNSISIHEKMMLFFYHFIPVDFLSVRNSGFTYAGNSSARICYRYMRFLRQNCLGNFKTLISQMSMMPAMMYYLNNQANSASAPDENFARELMELFTLGKDPASQYTQSDVVSAARVLTGWRVQNMNTANEVTNFVSTQHYQANKQFSSFFNNAVINNQAGAAGANETTELINMIFSKSQVVSQYICRRLYRFFVYYDIDSNIENNVIIPLAQTFVSNNWDIMPVLKQLFKSQHFYDVANRGVYIKTPFDLVAGMVNTFNIDTNATAGDHKTQYDIWNELNSVRCLSMEQRTGDVPNVSGWTAFYQTPAFHQYWINSNTIQQRFRLISNLISGYSVSGKALKIDVIAFVQQFPAATVADPNLLTDRMVKFLLPMDLSTGQKAQIKTSTLLANQITDSYWTTAWNNYIGAPGNASFKSIVDTRLRNLFSTICQLAEYQLT